MKTKKSYVVRVGEMFIEDVIYANDSLMAQLSIKNVQLVANIEAAKHFSCIPQKLLDATAGVLMRVETHTTVREIEDD